MLEELQSLMSSHISRVHTDKEETNKITTLLLENYNNEELSARLAIYRNNYFYTLTEQLKEVFPTVVKLFGEDFFSGIAREFIQTYPPCEARLEYYGEKFPAFTATFPPLSNYPYSKDIATLNYAQHLAWYAKVHPALKANDFATYSLEQIMQAKLLLDPSLFLIESKYSIFSIWQANEQDEVGEVDPSQAENVLIYREADNLQQIHTLCIEKGLFVFLSALKKGLRFENALEKAMESDSSFNASDCVHFLVSRKLGIHLLSHINNEV